MLGKPWGGYMKIFILLLLIFISITLFSCIDLSGPEDPSHAPGNIYGYVYDKISDEPVPGTRIIVLQGDDFTLTDSSGYFEIDSISQGYYSIFAIKEDYYVDSLNIQIKTNEEIPTNFSISFKGLYAITDSSRYHIENQQNIIKVRIINNAEYTHYLWWWCDIMFESYKYKGTAWEIFSARACLLNVAPQLIEIAAKDSTIAQMPISEGGKFYIKIPYRISEDDIDRLVYTNIFEVIKK